ncbi:YdbL family protein [Marinobacterium arenosum]|uniref:YdbL family protein n=1 Tax=Marinobacterium arenosum TaxID=2862496 RepID=UPI001C987AD2|nr:YdbL family protein [Marinobacterium arenosum]MBY4676343.1 YdbL family protein [Marinobacterium arenosum]
MKNPLKPLLMMLALLLVSLPGWALSLDDAKARGLVGEQSDGYLGIVDSRPNSEVRALVEEINRKRRAAYSDKAANAGVDLGVMELRIGQRLQQRAPSGQFIRGSDGRWIKK